MAAQKKDCLSDFPFHLKMSNSHHRRTIAASLVNGVYILEEDRQARRDGPNALASPWWKFFNFKLVRTLTDDVDNSIFGAIYEFKPQFSMCNDAFSPDYVIAFRGTLLKAKSFVRDIKLDFEIIKNRFHLTSRCEIALEAVRSIVDYVGASNIWLTGHSLGSSIAMHAGKTMANSGIFINSFLFNPPFVPCPIEKTVGKYVSNVVKAGVYILSMMGDRERVFSYDSLSEWTPYLFVNPSDYICSGYIGSFGATFIEKLACSFSLDRLHLIPSAYLTVNVTSSKELREVHGINQWLKPNLQLETNLHQY
ncbi:hypothetical protein VNO78_16137 [Psophocarpus tetragonolobus]|uniref:Triacylglycerol lipase n=1 Tax=Psophocarpus tetragonolobus TaxID=3891 RepID=A0AAN9SHS3_PSOTE